MEEKNGLQVSYINNYLIDTLILLVMPQLVACFLYGFRPLLLSVFTIAATFTATILCAHFTKGFHPVNLLSAIITGWCIALLMPASAPYWLPILGGIFAVFIAQLPFGSVEYAPFAPVAAGYAFLSVCFKDLVYAYPLTSYTPPLFGVTENASAISVAKMLKSSNVGYYDIFNIFSGEVVGPVGATCFAVLLASMLFLLIRNRKGFVASASFVFMCGLIAVIFPRVSGSIWESLLLELSSGSLMFFAVFVMPLPFLLPKTFLGQVAYGVFTGVICMLMRHIGVFEAGACFAILIMNSLIKFSATRKLLSSAAA